MSLASLGGVPFRIDPDSVTWDYKMQVAPKKTVGGKCIQVLGVQLGDMTVKGAFGYGDPARGDTMGWEAQERFRQQVISWSEDVSRDRTPTPLRFLYPPRKWDFQVYVTAMGPGGRSDPIRLHNEVINPRWTLTLFVVEDRTRVVVKGIEDLYIRRLMDGVGWRETEMNGPSAADVLTTLAGQNVEDYVKGVLDQRSTETGPAT